MIFFATLFQPQSQINKCNNEKRRRELENEYIEQLGEFLQINKRDMTACKPDKAAILSEVVKKVSCLFSDFEPPLICCTSAAFFRLHRLRSCWNNFLRNEKFREVFELKAEVEIGQIIQLKPVEVNKRMTRDNTNLEEYAGSDKIHKLPHHFQGKFNYLLIPISGVLKQKQTSHIFPSNTSERSYLSELEILSSIP